jgi:hypothetical protein
MSRLKTDAIRNVNASVDGITLDTSGNVAIPNKIGINTTSPEDLLHIKTGKIRIENAIVSNNDSTISYDNDTFLGDVDPNNVRGSSQFQIKIDTVSGLIIDDNRRVGIGTTSPRTKLDVTGYIYSSNGSQIQITGNPGSKGLQLIGQDDGTSLIGTMGSSGEHLLFRTASSERMRLLVGGSHLLLGGSSSVNEITESSANAGMVIGGTGFGNGGLAIINSTSGTGRIYFGDAVGSSAARHRGLINYYHNGDFMMFGTAGSERLRIDSSGKVGIGTTSPVGLLELDGGSGAFSIQFKETSQAWHRMGFQKNGSLLQIGEFNNDGSNFQPILNVDGNGDKVGIGTTSPPDKLNVLGAVRINQSSTLGHATNAGTMLEVRGDAIGNAGVDYDYFKGFKIALNDNTEWGGQAQFSVGRWQENGTNARSSLMISLGHGALNSSSDADKDVLLLTSDGQVRIEDGDLKIGTAGHGIDFSANPNFSGKTSELLDVYEEGTFTPSFGSAIADGNYSNASGWYTRIGNRCFFNLHVRKLSVSSVTSGALTVGNMPFNSASVYAPSAITIGYTNNFFRSDAGEDGACTAIISGGYNYVYLYDGTGANVTGSSLANPSQSLYMHGHYQVA